MLLQCCLCFIFVICPISLPGQLADLVDGWRRASPHSSLKHSLYDPWVLFNYSQSERHVRERAPPAFSSQALQRTKVCITSGTWFALKYIVSLHLNWTTIINEWPKRLVLVSVMYRPFCVTNTSPNFFEVWWSRLRFCPKKPDIYSERAKEELYHHLLTMEAKALRTFKNSEMARASNEFLSFDSG